MVFVYRKDVFVGRKSKIKEGDRFGNLTVIKSNGSHQKPSGIKIGTFLCRCDCGNLTVVRSDHLSGGDTKSCGCLMGRKILPNNGAAINKIIRSYKIGARVRGIDWKIKDSFAKELITKHQTRCNSKLIKKY